MSPMGPVQADVYVDPALTNFSIAYQDNRYIADKIFPTIPVDTPTGIYYVHDRSKFRAVNDYRAMGTRAQSVGTKISQATYGPLIDHELETPVYWELLKLAKDPLRLEMKATSDITQMSIINKEIDAFNKCADTAVVTQTVALSGNDRWDNYSTSTPSDPADDVALAVDTVKRQTHKSSTDLTVIIGYEVWSKLRNHPQMLERVKYSERGIVTTDLVAEVFNVKRVWIAEGEYNNTEVGQTDNSAYIWGKNVWVLLIDDTAEIDSITFGLTMQMGNREIDTRSDRDIKANIVRITNYYQQLVVAAHAGYLISTVVS
jgi:hypothetical protein